MSPPAANLYGLAREHASRQTQASALAMRDRPLRSWILAVTALGFVVFFTTWVTLDDVPHWVLATTAGSLILAIVGFARRRGIFGSLGLVGALIVGSLGQAPLAGLALATASAGCTGLAWSNERAAAWALACGPLAVLVALDQPGASLALAFPLVIVLCTLGAARLQRRIGHANHTPVATEPGTSRGWLGAGLAALIWLALILPIGAALAGLADLLDLGPDEGLDGPTQDLANTSQNAEDAESATQFDERFPSGLRYSGRADSLEPEAVLVARPLASERTDHEPLYLRGLVLDRFDLDGAHFDDEREPRIAASGDDGSIRLREAGGEPELGLDIDQRNLHIDETGASILFTPANTTAIALPNLHWYPGSRTAVPEPPPDGPHFELRYTPSPLPSEPPDPRTLELPAGPSVRLIRELAGSIAGDAENPRQLVQRIAAHFQHEFDYALVSTEQPGFDGVLDFLERKRGHCTYFAAATTLLLRARGVHARVATGFLASEWDEQENAWIVTTKNGHAWTEVYLDDRWERIDATPLDRRRAWIERVDEPEERRFTEWLGDVGFDLALWIRTRGEEPGLASLGATIADGPAALGRSLRDAPAMLAAMAILVAVLTWTLWKRRSKPRALALRTPTVDDSLRAEFVRTLARAGSARRTSQTLMEFARFAQERHPELDSAIEHAAVLDRGRWSEGPLTDPERETIRQWLRAIGQALRKRETSSPATGN